MLIDDQRFTQEPSHSLNERGVIDLSGKERLFQFEQRKALRRRV